MTIPTSWTKTLSLALVLAATPAAAQTILPTTDEDWTLRLQIEKPFLADVDGLAPISSILDTDVIIRWSSGVFFQAGIPLAISQQEFVDGTSIYIGNIRGNFLFGGPGELRSFLGMTLPTASNIGGPTGALLILGLPRLDEEEAWEADIFSVRGGLLRGLQISEDARLGVRLGGALSVPTDFDTVWLYARPGVWGRLALGTAVLRADLSTSYFANGDGEFADLMKAYLDLGAAIPAAWGYPEFFVRLPLDGQSRSALDFSVGFALRF